jgi:hypothetical protein
MAVAKMQRGIRTYLIFGDMVFALLILNKTLSEVVFRQSFS